MNKTVISHCGLMLSSIISGIILLLNMFGMINLPLWLFILFLLLLVGVVGSMALRLWAQHTLIKSYEREQEQLRKAERKLHLTSEELEALKREIDKIIEQWK